MKNWNYLLIFFIIGSLFVKSDSVLVDYSDHSLFVVTPESKIQIRLLQNVANSRTNQVDFWSYPRKIDEEINILVKNSLVESFSTFLDENQIRFVIQKVNLNGYNPSSETSRASLPVFDLNSFNSFDKAMAWLEKKTEACKICSIHKIGHSHQNRPITLIKIGSSANKGIFIDANMHAREWISSTSALHLIDILTNATNPLAKDLTSKFTFHIVPIANPDGYEYSRTSDRLWRKNRRTLKGSTCCGVDPNRNFKAAYGGNGSSGDKCSDEYRGTTAFSEPESKSVSDYIVKHKAKLICYVALHSYGRLILLPWGYEDSKPADYDELRRVAESMNQQIHRSTSVAYDVMQSSHLYPASGSSDDWAKFAGVKYSFTIELGPNRFDPPASEIFSLSREFIGAVRGLVDALPTRH